MNIKETIYEKLLYRESMAVAEILAMQNGYTFPICPRCHSSMEREYQSFCDRCGQRLSWKEFSKAQIV